jgi:hypothetical protein
MAKGKLNQVVVTAIARELVGFIWSIACITSDPPATDNAVTVSHDRVIDVSVDVATASEQASDKSNRSLPTQAATTHRVTSH